MASSYARIHSDESDFCNNYGTCFCKFVFVTKSRAKDLRNGTRVRKSSCREWNERRFHRIYDGRWLDLQPGSTERAGGVAEAAKIARAVDMESRMDRGFFKRRSCLQHR